MAAVKTLTKVIPPRGPAREAFMEQYHKLMDAAVDIEDSLIAQEDRLPPRARRSLNPKKGNKKIRDLVKAAQQCLEIATRICMVDKEGNWLIESIPPLPGNNMLPHQDQQFLDELGKHHRLYIGKYKNLYSRPDSGSSNKRGTRK